MTEDATVGWHHRVNGHEFEQILGDSEEKRSMLQSTHAVLQRVRHDLATEQKQQYYQLFSGYKIT